MLQRNTLIFFCIVLLSLSLSFALITVKGEKTWDLGYGIGSANLLSEFNHYNGLNIDQSLKAYIQGTDYATISGVPIGIKINGVFNDRNQLYYKLYIEIFKDNFHFFIGDYDHSINQQYLKFGDHLKGIGLKKDGKLGCFLGLSQIEGKSKTKTFEGESLNEHLDFNPENQYLLNSSGLESKNLNFNFTYNYTKVFLKFTDIASLTSYLSEYQMQYLIDFDSTDCSISIKNDGKYEINNYIVIPNNILLLTESSTNIIRDAVKYYINRYNEYKNLTSDNKKEYLNEDKDYQFLKGLRKYVNLSFSYPSTSEDYTFKRNGLYFYLINSNIIPQSIKITTSSSQTVQYNLINNTILKIDKKLSEFSVDYKYENTNSIYFLGFNVIPNSETVYLNNNILAKNIDYYIDYSTGFLSIFKKIKDTDIIIVKYQISTNSLGSNQYYNTYALIGSINYKTNSLSISLNSLSTFELIPKLQDYFIPEMPNNKYNLDLRATYKKNDIFMDYEGNLVYQDYKNPSKDHEPLKMNKSIKIYDFYIVSSNSGIIILKDGTTYNYSTKDGILSNRINDMCFVNDTLYLATDKGIAYIDLQNAMSEDPDELFSKDVYGESNWKYYGTTSGLEDEDVRSITHNSTEIYVCEESGIYKKNNSRFVKIISGDIDEVKFYNNDMYYIENGNLYKNGNLFLSNIEHIKILDNNFYALGENIVYNENKEIIFNGNVYDIYQISGNTYYSNKNGLYASDNPTTPIATECYYYISKDMAVGYDILYLYRTNPKHYKLNLTSSYYIDKTPSRYQYYQNHLLIKYGLASIDIKKDLKDKYIGVYLTPQYKNEKMELKFYDKYYDNTYKQFYYMYIGSKLFNIQTSISDESYSLSLNSEYSNPLFLLSNSFQYQNKGFIYKMFGENQKEIGVLKKLKYTIGNNGSSFYAHLDNNYFNSKIDFFYSDNKIQRLYIDPIIKYNLLGVNLQSKLTIKYPSISNHIYIEPYQYISAKILNGNLEVSASVMKDFGNQSSVDIVPAKISYSNKLSWIYYNIFLQKVYYIKNKLLQESNYFKAGTALLDMVNFNFEYKNDEHYNLYYTKSSVSFNTKSKKFGTVRAILAYNHYKNDDNFSSYIKYKNSYNQIKNFNFNYYGIFKLKYSIQSSQWDYGIYLGIKSSLDF